MIDAGRRQFLSDTLRAAGGATLCGLLLGVHAGSSRALPAAALRPPGALAEASFLAACIRCGLCVRACPFDTLRLATPDEAVSNGTPYFTAREIPCEMCDDLPCVKACPSGALDPALDRIDDARMGLAVVVDRESCIAFLGLRCEVCYNICPLADKAITLERGANHRTGLHALFTPAVHSDHCTGCGKCEQACILERAAIRVLPLALARGEAGSHYRLGWEEKARSGESLVEPDPLHRYHLPQGMEYEHGGRGLIGGGAGPGGEVPFPADPLESLRRGRDGL